MWLRLLSLLAHLSSGRPYLKLWDLQILAWSQVHWDVLLTLTFGATLWILNPPYKALLFWTSSGVAEHAEPVFSGLFPFPWKYLVWRPTEVSARHIFPAIWVGPLFAINLHFCLGLADLRCWQQECCPPGSVWQSVWQLHHQFYAGWLIWGKISSMQLFSAKNAVMPHNWLPVFSSRSSSPPIITSSLF